MKRVLIIIGSVLLFLFILAATGVYIACDIAIKENIQVAKTLYPGKAEDALIAYLLDSTISVNERSIVAVWTLGQIGSQKAKPFLLKLYKNDPKGITCYRRHNTVFCQSNLYKALNTIQTNRWPLHRHLNK